jgi:hypothetical protein
VNPRKKLRSLQAFVLVDNKLNEIATNGDYDKLQDKADRHNENINHWSEKYEVISKADLHGATKQFENGIVSRYRARRTAKKEYGKELKLSAAAARAAARRKVAEKKAQNPETFNANKIDELSAMFQGEITGEQIKSVGSDFVPNVTARIGRLSLMKIRNGDNLYELKFKRNGDNWLAMDTRKNLHVIGKDTVVKNAVKPKHGQLTLLGELEQVNYITAKRHIENGKLTEYYHRLGEVDGIKPNVFIDSEGFMIINGGAYDIGVNGVEN